MRHYARRDVLNGNVEIMDREFDFVRAVLPYDYRWTCNAQQWSEAERICEVLEGPMISLGIVVEKSLHGILAAVAALDYATGSDLTDRPATRRPENGPSCGSAAEIAQLQAEIKRQRTEIERQRTEIERGRAMRREIERLNAEIGRLKDAIRWTR